MGGESLQSLFPPTPTPIDYGRLREEFYKWLKAKHSKSHATNLISYMERYMSDTVYDHFQLKRIYDSARAGRRHLGLGIRNLLNFLEQFELLDEYSIEKYRKVVKLEKTGSDEYVPSDDEVREAYLRIRREELSLMFKLIMYSGIRLVEAVQGVVVPQARTGRDWGLVRGRAETAEEPLAPYEGEKGCEKD